MLEGDVLVVGAGPAGISAALEASLAGASVTLIDEYARLGGQYFKQTPQAFKLLDPSIMGRDYNQGVELMKRVEEGRIEIFPDTLVWGAMEPGVLEIFRRGECQRIRAQRTVIATGAYDRPVAFPGWTLPGVMTAGAAQTLLKNQWVVPGSRVLMVGSGPFQLPVAAHLVKAGATVVGVLEAGRFSGWFKQVPSVWRHLSKVGEAKDYLGALLMARVPMMYGWTFLEARGNGRVQEAVITQVDDQWAPIAGTEKVLEVDAVCIGFGFVPSLQLPRMLGCSSRWDAEIAAWTTEHDNDQRTSIATLFVAGETTGIGGHDVALGEGAIAGAAAAADLGYQAPEGVEKRLTKVREGLNHHRQFADFLNRTFAPKPGILNLIRDDTLLCRCEEVTAGEVTSVAKEWDGNLRTIKQLTRAGMGPCQGRICGPLVAQVAARASGKPMEEIGLDTPRSPIKPIPAGAIMDLPL